MQYNPGLTFPIQLQNGYYGEGCQAFFYTCLDGSAYKVQLFLPKGLKL